ncbi:hypothetical protein [Streptomyces sp. 8N616]|uniref:hypothetical protein n=1 Tax=Streptomyces sp. 8N616 TaxID=3457414 RepID=UPI003FD5EDB6
MSVKNRCLSIVAAAGVLGVALTAAQSTGAGDTGGAGAGPAPGPAKRPAPAPTARPLSFDYGRSTPAQSIGTPRAGICYPLGSETAATAFRNNTELRARLHSSPGCVGKPGATLAPGQSLRNAPPSASVVFSVGRRRPGGPR